MKSHEQNALGLDGWITVEMLSHRLTQCRTDR